MRTLIGGVAIISWAAIALADGDDALPKSEQAAPISDTTDLETMINRLGEGTRAERDSVMDEILQLGTATRDNLTPFLEHEDRRVRARVRRLWYDLRLAVIPGTGRAGVEFVRALSGRTGARSDRWQAFIGTHRLAVIPVFGALSDDKGYDGALRAGLAVLLSEVDVDELQAYLQGDGAAYRPGFLEFLRSRKFRIQAAQAVMIFRLARRLDIHDLTVMYGRLAWLGDAQAYMIPEIVDSVKQGGLNDTIWQDAGVLVIDRKNSANDLCRYLQFYAEIARSFNDVARLRTLLHIAQEHKGEDAWYKKVSPRKAQPLIAELIRLKMYTEAEAMTLRFDVLPIRYLREMIRQGRAGAAVAVPDERWGKILDDVGNDIDAFNLARMVAIYNMEHAKAIWKKILTIPPDLSIYDWEAAIRLADLSEAEGRFNEALIYYDAALGVAAEHGEILDRATLKDRGNHIRILREWVDGEADTAYFNDVRKGIAAMHAEDYGAAAQAFGAAVERRPDVLYGHWQLFQALKHGNRLNRMRAVGMTILGKFEPKDASEGGAFAQICTDLLLVDKAFEYSESVIRSLPDSPAGYISRAQAEEIKGALDAALADWRNVQKLANLGRAGASSLARIYCKNGEYDHAAEILARLLIIDPSDRLTRLQMHFARRAAGRDDVAALKQYIRTQVQDSSAWSGKLLVFAAGDMTWRELHAAARKGKSSNTSESRLCEAYFYKGLFERVAGNARAARKSFLGCVEQGVTLLPEHAWALWELERIRPDK